MLNEWTDLCLTLAERKADFYSGCRKIIRHFLWRAPPSLFDPEDKSGRMEDFGFTKSKMSILTKLYYNKESIDVAVKLWEKRKSQKKYGSVGFSFYNHLVKGGGVDSKRPKRASVMGPCLQACVLTLLDDGSTSIDIYYRTTEVFKKFPADLVFLRDTVFSNFDLGHISELTFFFTNVTVHPMYFITALPHIGGPIPELERLRRVDRHFWTWCVKWTGRYLCEEYGNGIQKFAQALRTQEAGLQLISKESQRKLREYTRNNWPGVKHRRTK